MAKLVALATYYVAIEMDSEAATEQPPGPELIAQAVAASEEAAAKAHALKTTIAGQARVVYCEMDAVAIITRDEFDASAKQAQKDQADAQLAMMSTVGGVQ